MLIDNPIAINVLVCFVMILLCYNDRATAIRCSRIPEGFGAKRTVSPGNFRLRLSDDSGFYKPGRTYTIWLERNSNSLRSRDRPRQTFTGFYLAVEQKKNTTNELSEDFSPVKHGIFKLNDDDTLSKMICGNVVMHTSDSSKTGVQVSWTAPEAGSGCVTFRATVIEHRDVWYMDDGPLSKDFCEDEDVQEDFITNVLEECCACYEAKYELTFEGLWSRNTHPKGFPRNGFLTKFGDIIGATHKIGTGFWANGEFASEGLREVAEMGSTRTLESELKNKSDSIRTIIKARGLAHPNNTGKTFAVFRVDSIHHLVSFVSMISPSPDWFVGISGLELCQADCTWLESKIIDLYPWDAGTDKGITYDASDQPSRPQDYIRRITSESPNNNDAPFFNPSGQKMKPLARLTLLRQRLYEKNCTAEQTASDDCQVTPYDVWGECTGACGGTGKKYRHRYYKNADRASKCHRKLFETKSCTMPPCKNDDNEDTPTDTERDNVDDPNCKGSWSEWSSCTPKCKNMDGERGKRTRVWRYEKGFHKMCAGRTRYVEPEVISCELDWCVAPSSQDQNETPERTNEEPTTEEPIPALDCSKVQYGEWKFVAPCSVTCGSGTRNRTRKSYNPECEDIFDVIPCNLSPCKNKEYCSYLPNIRNCQKTDTYANYVFYNASSCSCNEVFTTSCEKRALVNMFDTPDECREACPEANDDGCNTDNSADATFDAPPVFRRPNNKNRYRN